MQATVKSLSRGQLEAEVVWLREAMRQAGIDARELAHQNATRHAAHDIDLATSRQETADARADTLSAQADTQTVRDDLAVSQQLVVELQAVQQALRVSEERLALAFEAAGSLGWWDWDIPADRLYAGAEFARMYGVDAAGAMVGAPLEFYVNGIHPDDRAWVAERIQHTLATAGVFSEEYRLQHADGTVTWVYARGRCYHNADGQPSRFPGVALDITARKRASAELAASESRLSTVMETIPVGIMLAEAPSGRVVMGNSQGVAILGHDTHYAASSEAYDAFVAYHADGRLVGPSEYPLARICGGECDQATMKVEYQRPDGMRIWIEIIGAAIKDASGQTTGAVVAYRDIADRKAAEAQQDTLNHELAHRLKNTLAIVQSIAAQTLRGVSEREPVAAFERRVLALSRAHDVLVQKTWSAAELHAVMEGVLSMQADMQRFVIDGPELDVSPQAALSLSLLLHELATNALKYGALSEPEGRVHIAWRVEHSSTPTLVLNWHEHGGPTVVAPTGRGGFGSKLIRSGLMGTRATDLRYNPLGLRAEFRAPLAEVQVYVS